MGNFNFFKAFQIFSFISGWAMRALEDGKVTIKEGSELVIGVCQVLGVQTELEIFDADGNPFESSPVPVPGPLDRT